MQLQLIKDSQTKAGTIDVSELVFGREFSEGLIHQVITAYQANGRQGSRAQLTKAQVRGGGKKPWKQKGTGRARVGSIRSPIWVGGGRAHPATPNENFKQKINKKMYRAAMCAILSELIREERVRIVEEFIVPEPKTKALLAKLKDLGVAENTLILTDSVDDALYLSVRNIIGTDVHEAASVDPVSLVGFDNIIMTVAAVKQLEERLA